jgi:hypothetical protein
MDFKKAVVNFPDDPQCKTVSTPECSDESQLHGNRKGVVFIPLEGETNAKYRERMKRWKAGYGGEGSDRPYTGREPLIGTVRFVGREQVTTE